MRSKLRGQRGMSLVEATIILSVLALLTSVLAPSVMDFVNDAKDEKVKEDIEEIGVTIVRALRDTGSPFLQSAFASTNLMANRVDVLFSDGANPTLAASAVAFAPPLGTATPASLNWNQTGANTDAAENQFVLNTPVYPSITPNYTKSGPQLGLGWRGAYLASPVGADPWGNRYEANTVFLGVASNATAGTGEGQASGGWRNDVLVLSAGRNGVVETPFAGSVNGGTSRTGDDVVYVVQGTTR